MINTCTCGQIKGRVVLIVKLKGLLISVRLATYMYMYSIYWSPTNNVVRLRGGSVYLQIGGFYSFQICTSMYNNNFYWSLTNRLRGGSVPSN